MKEEKNRKKVIPYVQGLTEKSIIRVFKKRMVSIAVRPHLTRRNMLVHAKNKLEPGERVYSIDCEICEQKYIGESNRKLTVKMKEHRE